MTETIPTAPLQAPPRRYDYVADGPAIYVDSFATIRRESDLSGVPAEAEKVAVLMIHGSGQTDLVRDLVIHPGLVPAARGALAAGAPILCDARMVAMGITAGRLPADNPVHCFLTDERVPGLAREWSTTRTAAADHQHVGVGDLRAGEVGLVDEGFGLQQFGQLALAVRARVCTYGQLGHAAAQVVGVVGVQQFVRIGQCRRRRQFDQEERIP